jgi:hypothetical protein
MLHSVSFSLLGAIINFEIYLHIYVLSTSTDSHYFNLSDTN